MRAYYLDQPLSEDELAFVSESLGIGVEQVRLPYVFPAPGQGMRLDDGLLKGCAGR